MSDTPAATTSRAVIDLEAVRRNVRHLAEIAAPASVMLAVKADAYGHGLAQVARAGLEAGATSLAVLEVPAGLELRCAGIGVPLLAWLHGTETDWRAAIDAEIDLGISAVWQLEAIAASGATRPAVVHLKVDTGLTRNGATREHWPGLVTAALELERRGLVTVRAAWSHLADASEADDRAALGEFCGAVAEAEALGARFELLHLAASSAGIRMPEARFDLVRFGIAAYGYSPFDDRTGADLGLVPAMRLEASVIEVETGDLRQARVGIGYADGIPTSGLEATTVGWRGRRLGVLQVDVDSTLVSIGDHPVVVGDTVVLFGPGDDGEVTAEEYAAWSGTIADEMVTGVAPRVPRVYVG